MRRAGNITWTGQADVLIFPNSRYVAVSTLKPGDEFKLFGWLWRVRRQANRMTLADGLGQWKGCSIQLQHSREVGVPTVVRAERESA